MDRYVIGTASESPPQADMLMLHSQRLCAHSSAFPRILAILKISAPRQDSVAAAVWVRRVFQRSCMASSSSMASSGDDAALAAAVLELERARMRLEDVQSYMAQRHWVNSLQVPETGRRMTWESLFRMRHNDLVDAHSALEQVRDLLNQDDAQAALEVALDVVGHAAEPSEQSEESPLDDDPEVSVQDMRQQLLEAAQLPAPAAELSPFRGRCFRLDM